MGESMTLEGATDALAFEAYVEHVLAPSLSEGQVVVLDKLLVAHRTEKVKDLIEERGAYLVFLERTRTAYPCSSYECAVRRCRGLHRFAYPAFLSRFLFSGLLRVA
jgi:hypothetical protein